MQKPQSSKSGSSPRGRGKRTQSVGRDHGGGLIPARAGKTASWRWPSLPVKAHPRVGGENGGQGGDRRPLGGSSPRGRGKRSPHTPVKQAERLIPAWAGKTSHHHPPKQAPGAHPRMGGENGVMQVLKMMDPGSSPRGRGKRPFQASTASWARLIPARAGKTHIPDLEGAHLGAHPRAGGENPSERCAAAPGRGSSPRGRGKLSARETDWPRARLIPARAGKTPWATLKTLQQAGSSPRGRGKRLTASSRCISTGLIPARAGKTGGRTCPPASPAAHPRAGGENWLAFCAAWSFSGSSPRGRGKHIEPFTRPACVRLIPARAGKTFAGFAGSPAISAHPRAGGENQVIRVVVTCCGRLIPARAGKTGMTWHPARKTRAHPRAGGENFHLARALQRRGGSSPRGRGKLQGHGTKHRPRGLIPARAGKTDYRRNKPEGWRAHPRAGGENLSRYPGGEAWQGSSPRGRGKPKRLASNGVRPVAHPRAGGEN